jgi:hypothetical protein
MVTRSQGRAAAWTAAAILTVSAGFQFYWGQGGMLGLPDVSDGTDPPVPEPIGSVVIGLIMLAFAGVLLVRAGYWHEHVPFAVARLARILAWVIVVVQLVNALAAFGGQSDVDRFVGGPAYLIIAVLAFVVARSELPVPPGSGAAPMPSGRPSPRTSAH